MAKKRYSVQARAAYHRARVKNADTPAGKKVYSLNWLDGYTDNYARGNYSIVCGEISRKKGKMSRNERAVIYGFRNGLKAQLDSKK